MPGVGTMNVASGFDTSLSFYYTTQPYSAPTVGAVTIYDGLGASGNILAQTQLPVIGDTCKWTFISMGFSGVAKSVAFSGAVGYIGWDNITLLSSSTCLVRRVS